MDYTHEHYVRLYKRDTTNQLMISWRARGFWRLLLTKFDRAGILDLGAHGKRGVCVHIAGAGVAAWPEIEPLLDELLDDGCVEFHERDGVSYLVAPNYIEANEAKQSDRARSKAYRERQRDLARAQQLGILAATPNDTARDDGDGPPSGADTARDTDVTVAHTVPHAVTPSLAEPSLAEPDRGVPPAATDRDGTAKPKRSSTRGTRLPDDWQPDQALFDYAATNPRVRMYAEDVRDCAEDFRDYWHGVSGARGVKRDWSATFKRWLRTTRERRGDQLAWVPTEADRAAARQREADAEQQKHQARQELLDQRFGDKLTRDAADPVAAQGKLAELLGQAGDDSDDDEGGGQDG